MTARKPTAPLSAALAALEARDLVTALHKLLASWRKVPAIDVATAIDETSRALRAQQAPLSGKPGRERGERWEALASKKRPEDLELLFEDLITNAAATSALRIRQVAAAHPRDPRLARWLTSLCAEAPFRSDNSATFWTMVAQTLAELEDPRTLTERLHGDRFTTAKALARAKQKLAGRYPQGAPVLSEADSKVVGEIRAQLRAWAPAPTPKKVIADGAALLKGVYEAPGDLTKRLVYADFLLEQGDPRGEFIQLQVQRAAGTARKGSAAREKALFTEHWQAWLGGLRHLPRKGLEFRAGFLDAARPRTEPEGKHVEWTTCSTIDWSNQRMFDAAMTKFCNSKTLTSLVRMLGLRPAGQFVGDVAGVIARTRVAAQLEVLGFTTNLGARDAPPELSDLASFPRLKELWWFDRYSPLSGLRAMRQNAVTPRLERLRAENGAGDVFTLSRGARGGFSVMQVTLATKWIWGLSRALVTVEPGWLDELHVTTTVKLEPTEPRAELKAQLDRLGLGAVTGL